MPLTSGGTERVQGRTPDHGIARVVERPAESQIHAVFPKLVSDGAGIRDGPGRTVEFRHDQRVAFAHGTEGLVEAGAGTGRAGEAVTSLDAILGDRIQPAGEQRSCACGRKLCSGGP